MNYKNIMFDLDGTVTDPYMGITNSILYSLKYYPDIEIPLRETLKPFIGPPLYASYMKYFGMDKQTATEAVEHYREYYSVKGKFENELYEGIPELLADLKNAGARIALVTSKPKVFAKQILEHFDINKYFDYVAGSTLDGSLIEKADLIERLHEVSGFSGKETVMVGDTVYDIEGARHHGMSSVAVAYGYGERADIEAAEPDRICESVEELRRILLER